MVLLLRGSHWYGRKDLEGRVLVGGGAVLEDEPCCSCSVVPVFSKQTRWQILGLWFVEKKHLRF